MSSVCVISLSSLFSCFQHWVYAPFSGNHTCWPDICWRRGRRVFLHLPCWTMWRQPWGECDCVSKAVYIGSYLHVATRSFAVSARLSNRPWTRARLYHFHVIKFPCHLVRWVSWTHSQKSQNIPHPSSALLHVKRQVVPLGCLLEFAKLSGAYTVPAVACLCVSGSCQLQWTCK